MKKLSWPAPAKINLFLHIIGQRADGYHELQTVFQFLNYCDELHFTVRNDDQLHVHSTIPELAEDGNLILRAAQLLQKTCRTNLGIDVILHKRIPIGGGLGGGSSNAATTLLALNQLWQLQLTKQDLLGLGLQLGADVPIFIEGKACWGEGIGEKLTPINLPQPWYVVVIPPHPVSTAKIFSDPELTRNTPTITIQQFLDGQVGSHNDCEAIVRKHYPLIGTALDWLGQYAPARLTGTGGCVFAAVANAEQANALVAKVPAPFKAFAAEGLNHSPLS